jgi:two-component system sensor histidine kinase YesM
MKKHRRSLKVWLSVFCLALAGVLISLIGYNDYMAARLIQGQTYAAVAETAKAQATRLRDGLAKDETYLAGFVYNDSDVILLEKGTWDDLAWNTTVYQMQQEFNSALTVQLASAFFLYTPECDLFLNTSSGMPLALRGVLKTYVKQGTFFTDENAGMWLPLQADGIYYLARVVQVHSSYVGAVINVDQTIRSLVGYEENFHFDFALADGTLLSASAPVKQLEGFASQAKEKEELQKTNVDGQTRLLITQPVARTKISLVVLVPDQALQASAKLFQTIIALVLIGVTVVLLGGFALLQKAVMHPIERLTIAIRSLRSGNPNIQVETADCCTEFDEMNLAFNDMVREIKTLRINVYEEQLCQQQTEIEYLKLQMTPHFLINCLNTVYQLTEAQQPELTLCMIRDLSCHLRYLLNSGASVSLQREAELVANFVELSLIRYPGAIRLTTEYDPEAMNCRVIPLLMLNFVENTVKYEVEVGKVTEIHISVQRNPENGKNINIEIWDTGRGFSPDMLARLQDVDEFVKWARNNHIGIGNVFLRARLILGDGCCFRFDNRVEGGARIRMEIPYQPEQEDRTP